MAFNIQASFQDSFLLATSIFLMYILVLGIKRLYFDPISQFPGPKLAALTFWYEFYYDCILGGQYSAKILDLHKEYNSNVIRINPFELHFSDPDFHSELFTGITRKRDNCSWFAAQFGAPESHFTTADHDLHRERRAAMAPFFSMASVRNLQPVIEERVDKMLERFREYRDRGDILDTTLVFTALTNDIISEFSFARSEHLLERPDLGVQTKEMLEVGTHRGHLMKHLPLLRQFIESLPESLIVKAMPAYGAFVSLKQVIADQIGKIQTQKKNSTWHASHKTIFHEILDSKLPPHEKTATRLASEGRIVLQAGTLTTAWTLSLTLYYILSQPSTLERLHQELLFTIPNPEVSTPLPKLEQLPYLTACIKEGLRLSFGASSRLPRIPTDESLTFKDKKTGKEYEIPCGTKCSMTLPHISTDPEIWGDPDVFRPERWIGDEAKERELDKFFIPFATGSRACLGRNLAFGELYLTLGKLFRLFGREDGGKMRLFETTERDVKMAADYFIVAPWSGSKGVRVLVDGV